MCGDGSPPFAPKMKLRRGRLNKQSMSVVVGVDAVEVMTRRMDMIVNVAKFSEYSENRIIRYSDNQRIRSLTFWYSDIPTLWRSECSEFSELLC